MMKPLFVFFTLWVCCTAGAASDELTSRNIADIKQICRALAGVEVASSKSDPILHRLAPYVEDEVTLSKLNAVCDTGCRALITLRGGAEIYFTYTNIPDKHNRITTVVFRKHDKVLLSIPSDGAR
jgi:hypothetical protein